MTAEEVLGSVATRVLEDCAFLFLEPSEETSGDRHDALASTIAIRADRLRVLKLVASRPLLVEAAANMLGTEGDNPEALGSAEQAITELLNVVAGSLVAELYGTERECVLGIPERAAPENGSKSAPESAPDEDSVVVTFRADSGHILRLELR